MLIVESEDDPVTVPRSAEHYRRRFVSAADQAHLPLPRDRHQILRGLPMPGQPVCKPIEIAGALLHQLLIAFPLWHVVLVA